MLGVSSLSRGSVPDKLRWYIYMLHINEEIFITKSRDDDNTERRTDCDVRATARYVSR